MGAFAVAIMASLVVAWTIPAELPGTAAEGAMMMVNLQGLVFTIVGVVRGAWFCWRNRADVWGAVKDFFEVA